MEHLIPFIILIAGIGIIFLIGSRRRKGSQVYETEHFTFHKVSLIEGTFKKLFASLCPDLVQKYHDFSDLEIEEVYTALKGNGYLITQPRGVVKKELKRIKGWMRGKEILSLESQQGDFSEIFFVNHYTIRRTDDGLSMKKVVLVDDFMSRITKQFYIMLPK